MYDSVLKLYKLGFPYGSPSQEEGAAVAQKA
jgi:hypothetical protein